VIAGLLLAAGRSTRFGGDKLLAPLRGRPVLFWSAAAIATEVDALYVVVPPLPDSAARVGALAGIPAVLVEHVGRDAGMASSIRAGMAALPADVEAVVIALADQPLVSPRVVRSLCERWRDERAGAIVPLYRDGHGHPVLFDRAHFAALGELRGDRGARALLERLGDERALVPVDAAMPVDVDTPAALRALAAVWRGAS
jgi:molybdenum cofactor cytidylyltransferase